MAVQFTSMMMRAMPCACFLLLMLTTAASTAEVSSKSRIAEGADPDIAVASDGTMHVAYVRAATTFYRRGNDRGEWQTEVEVGPGVDPCIAVGPDQSPHIAVTSHYAGNPGGGGATIRYSRWSGRGFASPRVIADGACRKPRIAVDTKGQASVVYEDRRHDGQRVRCVSVAPDGAVSGVTVLGKDDTGGLVVDPGGSRRVTWRGGPEMGLQCTSMAASGEVNAPVAITPPASDFSDVALHPADGSLHVVGQVAGAGGIYYVAETADGRWQQARRFPFPEATRVADADLVNPGIVVDTTGRRYVAFTGEGMLPYYLVIDDRGEAGPLQRVDPGGGTTGGKYMNPQLASAPGGGAIVVWGSQGVVWLARLD